MKVKLVFLAASMVSAVSGCGSDGASPDSIPDGGPSTHTDAPLGDAPQPTDCRPNVTGVTVDDRELAGYPSYAVDACRLVYVARATEAGAYGELRLRDLGSGDEMVIAQSDEAPRRPTVAGDVIAWEAFIGGRDVVRVWYRGRARTLTGPFDHAGEPRAAADGVVFTIWTTPDPLGDTDVDLFLPDTGELVPIAHGPNQQRFADISPTLVAFTDFSEDPDGRYDGFDDLADIVIYDRATHEIKSRPLPGKQAFPMLLEGDQMGYLHWDWAEIHPEPKLAAYHLRAASLKGTTADREIANVVFNTPPYIRPAGYGSTLEWVDSRAGMFQLWRASASEASPPAVSFGVPGVALYAPAPTRTFTALATRPSFEQPPRLATVARASP